MCLSIIFNTNICKYNLFYYVFCTEEIWLGTIFRVRVSVRVMLFIATFNNISVISWWSVLLVNVKRSTRRKLQVTDNLYHIIIMIMLYRVHLATLVVICTDCIGSCKSNYHANTTTTAPPFLRITHVHYMYQYLL